jgi:type I restriction enzyme S subunit
MISSVKQDGERVPEGWGVVPLSDVFKLSSGKTRPVDMMETPTNTMKYPIFGGNGIVGYGSSYLVDREVVVIGRVGEYCGSVHKAPKNSWITDNALYSVEFYDKKIDMHFFVETLSFLNLNSFKRKSGQPLMTQEIVYSIKILLPPLPEQHRIATILTTVDDAIQRSRHAAAETERLKAGVMQELMTKGIGHTEFREDPDVGTVPKEWMISQLGKFAEIIMGQSPSGETYNGDKNGVPLINGPVEFGLEYPTPLQWTSAPTKICNKDDILFCVRGNTTARINIADQPYCIGRGIAAIRGIKGASITTFIKFTLINRHDSIYQMAVGGGSTFPNITSKQLSELKLVLPSVAEQDRIATILSTIDRKLTLQRQRTAHYEHLKQGLMNELLTGKLRVKVT